MMRRGATLEKSGHTPDVQPSLRDAARGLASPPWVETHGISSLRDDLGSRKPNRKRPNFRVMEYTPITPRTSPCAPPSVRLPVCASLDINPSFKNTARLMAEPKENPLMEKIVSLCKRRGFIFQSSEIYGGINGFWDYGPLGAELKRNVKELWWRNMTQKREDVVGLEASIIMHPKIWEASGHTSTFSDPMVDCFGCKKRFRADQIEARSGTAYSYVGAFDEKL